MDGRIMSGSTTSPNRSNSARPVQVRTVSQCAFIIKGESAFLRAVSEIVFWMRERNKEIPEVALDGLPFQVGIASEYAAEAVRIEENSTIAWSAKLEDRRDFPVTGRVWLTETTVVKNNDDVAVAIKLSQYFKSIDENSFNSRPNCVFSIIENLSAISDGWLLTNQPTKIEVRDVDRLIELLTSRSRRMPVLVAFSRRSTRNSFNIHQLSRQISGLCHIVILTEESQKALEERLGKIYAPTTDSIRIYRTDFDPENSNPYEHPLWRVHGDAENDSKKVVESIKHLVTSISSTNPNLSSKIPTYEQIRERIARAEISHQRDIRPQSPEYIALLEEEISKPTKDKLEQKELYDTLISSASDEVKIAEAQRDEAKHERAFLISRIINLESEIRNLQKSPPSTDLKDFSSIDEWCKENLAGSIWVSRKAIRECEKNCEYQNPEHFGATLIALRDYLVPLKRNKSISIENYTEKLRELGVEDRKCFSNSGDIKNFPEYKVTYYGREYWCTDHIKFGGGTDRRKMFRIYYFWNDEDKTLVIGSMPNHLDNNLTN